MKNKKQQALDYVIPVDILKDWQIDNYTEYHPAFCEIDNIKKRVEVLMTQDEWDEYQSKKWLAKELYLRDKALDLL